MHWSYMERGLEKRRADSQLEQTKNKFHAVNSFKPYSAFINNTKPPRHLSHGEQTMPKIEKMLTFMVAIDWFSFGYVLSLFLRTLLQA